MGISLPSLSGATGWLNTTGVKREELRGRVVLANFWTYTCINWLRTLPYLRAWDEKYRPYGLVILGIHTPEFGVEHDPDNVKRAVRDMDIRYPVALDNDYKLWQAFDNHYWPASYFADITGQIVHHQFGEGEYDLAEEVIQRLLTEAVEAGFDRRFVKVQGRGVEEPADWENLGSSETYLGYQRGTNFSSNHEPELDKASRYSAPDRIALNHWSLSGDWTLGKEAPHLNKPGGGVIFRFHARDLNLVSGPAKRGDTIPFQAYLDGEPLGAAHGADANERGEGKIHDQRLYQLVRQPEPIFDRQFEIRFLEPGVEALAFTFG